MDLLLLSNSTEHGRPMFAHAVPDLLELARGDEVVFVPFALADWDDYEHRVRAALAPHGVELTAAHRAPSPRAAILEARVVLVGGGNTFRLLDSLLGLDVVEGLAARVADGTTRYVGSSAGTNVVCPTIRTTNDMPICRPPTFAALGVLPFQVNLHYVDPDPDSTHMGETRDERIEEFLEENDCPVLALYEGSWLRVRDDVATLHGPGRLFERTGVQDLRDGDEVSSLLRVAPRFDLGARPRPSGSSDRAVP